MQIEDRLDDLLNERLQRPPQTQYAWMSRDDELAPLLLAADELAPMRVVVPSAEFAWSLEQRLLAYTTSLAPTSYAPVPRNVGAAAVHAPNEEATRGWRATQQHQRRWRFWQIVAAALLLIAGATALTTAAASAGPGSFLFGLHRAEQSVRLQLASTQGDRIRLHLSYAEETLSQLNDIVARRAGDPAYSAALVTYMAERQAVAQGLASLPPGAEHDALAAQLANLTTQSVSSLRAALPTLNWSDRVATTQALGELGEPVLVVTNVQITHEDGQNAHLIRIVAQGSGFAVGAVITADGQVVGTVILVTATQVIVEIDASGLRLPPHNVGVSNPDGTAAVSPHFEIDNPSDHGHSGGSHPTPVVTPHSH